MLAKIRNFFRHDCADNRFYCEYCLDDKQRNKILDLSGRPIA